MPDFTLIDRRTDEEMERRLKANLAADLSVGNETEICQSGDVYAQVDDILDGLRLVPQAVCKPSRAGSPVMAELIARKQIAIVADHESNRKSYYEAINTEARADYNSQRLAEGKTVRGYDRTTCANMAPGLVLDVRRKKNCSAMRAARGKTDGTVRSYADLSDLTGAEKVEHRRQQANARKRAQRGRVKIEVNDFSMVRSTLPQF